MKRGSLAACWAISVAAGLLLLPLGAAGQTPTGDSAVGSFTVLALDGREFGFEVDAHSGPSSESPNGTVVITEPDGDVIDLSVVCLTVTGATAVLGANDDQPAPFTSGLFIQLADGSPDTFAVRGFIFDPPPGPNDCTPGAAGNNPLPLATGDLVVTDAQTTPTSKAQCKNGGWRNFASFKNQGDCVSFVATKGKDPPANSP
jgi:hypothetical protein